MLNLNSKMCYFQFIQGSGLGFKNWKNCQPLKETCGQRKRKASWENKSSTVCITSDFFGIYGKTTKKICLAINSENKGWKRILWSWSHLSDVSYTNSTYSLWIRKFNCNISKDRTVTASFRYLTFLSADSIFQLESSLGLTYISRLNTWYAGCG